MLRIDDGNGDVDVLLLLEKVVGVVQHITNPLMRSSDEPHMQITVRSLVARQTAPAGEGQPEHAVPVMNQRTAQQSQMDDKRIKEEK